MTKLQNAANLFLVSMLIPRSYGVGFVIKENRGIGKLEVTQLDRNIGLWEVGPERLGVDDQLFKIKLQAANPEEGKMRWGLSQTLLQSTRLTCFQGDAGCINIRPPHEPRILDGKTETIPFFDENAVDILPADGTEIEVRTSDGPNIQTVDSIYLSAQGKGGQTQPFSEFRVEEKFLISVTQEKPEGDKLVYSTVYQCQWTYSYTLNTFSNGQIFDATSTKCEDYTGDPKDAIFAGPVATDGAFRQYNPESLKDFNEVRYTEGRNPEDPPRSFLKWQG